MIRSRAWLDVLLAVALVGSCIVLVRTAYETRRLFNALERAQAEARQLEVDQQRLEADRLAQATSLRVEQVARQKLQMRTANPGVTHWLQGAEAAAAAPGGVR